MLGSLAGTSFEGLAASSAPLSTIPPAPKFDFSCLSGGAPEPVSQDRGSVGGTGLLPPASSKIVPGFISAGPPKP